MCVLQNLVVQGSLLPDDVPNLFSQFSKEGKMNLGGLQGILMYLSVTPLRSSLNNNSKNANILEKKVSNIVDNNVEDNLNSFIEPEEQFIDEMTVEKSFAELSGKRKIVTYESLVGWDVVAELLQDGALNKEVRVVWCSVVWCSVV